MWCEFVGPFIVVLSFFLVFSSFAYFMHETCCQHCDKDDSFLSSRAYKQRCAIVWEKPHHEMDKEKQKEAK